MNQSKPDPPPVLQPRLVIHGGAGNIQRHDFEREEYDQYRSTLLTIVSRTDAYMNSTIHNSDSESKAEGKDGHIIGRRPSALEIATHAVVQLEDHPLFNSGHGSVFTRDGTNELEASVMVSRGFKKRGVGVMGLRNVRNPILLARKMLENGDRDLEFETELEPRTASSPEAEATPTSQKQKPDPGVQVVPERDIDVPSAQGHTLIHGEAAEKLARQYGCEMVDPSYFFTQKRWDEHVRALEKERQGQSTGNWDAEEFLPQGTCGAVAMDEQGVICAATSTGGLTNKVSGRIGDTPIPGAGFWATEWLETGDPTGSGSGSGNSAWQKMESSVTQSGLRIAIAGPLLGFLADCLPTPWVRSLLTNRQQPRQPQQAVARTTRSLGVSGTGTGDSFVRIAAARTVAAMAQYRPEPGAKALTHVAGPGGELQESAGDRWGKTGEGEGGMIGIESVVVRNEPGQVVETRSKILMDCNCAGMFRAWIDDNGKAVMSIWSNGSEDKEVMGWY